MNSPRESAGTPLIPGFSPLTVSLNSDDGNSEGKGTITSDNVIAGHSRFLGILQNFWNTYRPVQIQHKEDLESVLTCQYSILPMYFNTSNKPD